MEKSLKSAKRSHTRRPVREALLEYAGPIPFLVVPMLLLEMQMCVRSPKALLFSTMNLRFPFLSLSFSFLQAIHNLVEIKDCRGQQTHQLLS